MKMDKPNEIRCRMIVATIFWAFIACVSGLCEDDLVPLEAGQFPAVWNIGTLSHVFVNSEHMRGVASCRDYKILGLDTVTTSLYLCPVDMTIYGNLTAGFVEFMGNYTNQLDFINHGSHIFGHGAGFVNMTFVNLQLRNLVAPIRYSPAAKRLQIENMQYEVHEDLVSPIVTGMEIDGEGAHAMRGDELERIDQTGSFTTAVELVRAILNTKVKKGILLEAVKQMFASAFSL